MKVLVLGLIGVANVLAAFAEGGTAIDVAAGAKLRLDYFGTVRVQHVRIGGRSYSGLIPSARFPSAVTGPGEILLTGSLFGGFVNPPDEAKPRCRPWTGDISGALKAGRNELEMIDEVAFHLG